MENVESGLRHIGIIHTPFKKAEGTPIQPVFGRDATGTVELFADFAAGLEDLDGFDRIWLVYKLHRSLSYTMRVKPFLDNREHGLFATRSPNRPNSIGLSAVRLLKVNAKTLEVGDVDMLDGTPLLDIKPYIPKFDSHPGSRAGWYDENRVSMTVADGRFVTGE